MKKYLKILCITCCLILHGCTTQPSSITSVDKSNIDELEASSDNVLIAYFSRVGNTEYASDVDATTSASIVVDQDTFGTTEYIARMIQNAIGGDLHLIEVEDTYPTDFNALRDLNHQEKADGTIPTLKESDLDILKYDTILIGYPIWASDVPQAIRSFIRQYDFTDKTIIPFCTHDGYGAGNSYSSIQEEAKSATVLDGIAIDAEDVLQAQDTINTWLESLHLITNETSTNVQITIGDTTLDAILYDTPLAKEIQQYFPLTLSMSNYGNREYYGGVSFYPENLEEGKNTFENGDITYCEAHHNMAIFYAQTDNPILSVNVIPIGKVTSSLDVFDIFDSREEVTFSIKA